MLEEEGQCMGQTTPIKAECRKACPSYSKFSILCFGHNSSSHQYTAGYREVRLAMGPGPVLGPGESFAFSGTDLDSHLISTILAAILVC